MSEKPPADRPETPWPEMPHPFSEGRPDGFVFQTVSTSPVRPTEQYEYWRETVVRRTFDLPRPDDVQRGGFHASITSLATPTSEFHSACFDAFQGRRSRRRIRCEPLDGVALLYVHAGTLTGEQDDDVEFSARAGDFYLYDPSVPTDMAFDASQIVELDLSRTGVTALAGRVPPASVVGEALRASGLTAMLRQHLNLLPRILGTLDDPEKLVAVQATEALALTVLDGALAAHANGPGPGRRSRETETRYRGLFTAAHRYIEDNLDYPDLDAARLAGALGCSRATLYRVFSHHGWAVADYIRDVRLARLRALLERASAVTPIAGLAARCGLYDTPNLSRLFRAKFGLTPSEARETSRRTA